MQRIKPELDTIYASEPYGFNQLMSKKMTNYKYTKSGILLNTGLKKITRYAKDYKIGSTPVTLLVISFSGAKKVETALDNAVEQIKKDNKLKSIVAQSTMRPLSLGVKI